MFHQINRSSLPLWTVLMGAAFTLVIFILFLLPAQVQADTYVAGPITTNTTWNTVGSPYIITGTVQVANGARLTIQPNVTVKFNLGTSLQIDGTLVAQDCTFTTNDPTPARGDWGHIFFTAASADATYDAGGNYTGGSMIQGCLIEWGGGGAGITGAVETNGASPFIHQNTIRNNAASGIHAIGRSASQSVLLQSNNVSNNYRSGDGGGIYVSAGQVISNTVTNNETNFVTGRYGGGIYASNSTLQGNLVNANHAYSDGGGIYATGSALTANTVSGNSAGGALGGGIYSSGSTLTANTVSGNSISRTSAANGGGIYANGGTVINNLVSGNTLVSSGNNAYGSGIYAASSTVSGNSVQDNTATANSASYSSRGGGIYANAGTVSANMVNGNTVSGLGKREGGGVYGLSASITGNTLDSNEADQGGGFYGNNATLLGNTIRNNNATNKGGGIYAGNNTTVSGNSIEVNYAPNGGGAYVDTSNFTGNTVDKNTADSGAGVYAVTSVVRGNTVQGNTTQSDGGGIYANGGTVESNSISQNNAPSFGHGSGAYLTGSVEFTYNSVVTNTATGGSVAGLAVDGQLMELRYNNIYNNLPYDAEVVSSETVTATYNYWGPVPCADIGLQVYDGKDIPGRGNLLYGPSLYAPPVTAHLTTPTGLILTEVDDTTITLTWQAIPAIPTIGCREPGSSEPDLGYRLYYDTNGMCSYDGQGLFDGDSPIDVGQDTTITLTGLSSPDDFYFSVTAYDYLGRESIYSNSVLFPGSGGIKNFLPLILRQG